jgi:hypothetical protein
MEREVFQLLISVLMEDIRLKNEKSSDAQLMHAGKDGHKLLELKSKPTAGRRIGLDIGSKLQIEIMDFDSLFESFLVGMIPEEFLIITLSPHFSANGHIPVLSST